MKSHQWILLAILTLGLAACVVPSHTISSGIVVPLPVIMVGTPDCQRSNMQVEVVDDIETNQLTLVVNGFRRQFVSAKVEKFQIYLCGPSNSFSYQLGTASTRLRLPRTFEIYGYDGFDFIIMKFDTNAAGQLVTMQQAPKINLSLGELPDQVEIRTNNIAGGNMTVNARLGGGNDGFSFLSRPHTSINGDLLLSVEGEQGDDDIYLDLWDNISIPATATLSIQVSGDMLLDRFSSPISYDNVADHGADRIIAAYGGIVQGNLTMQLWGDDPIIRIPDLDCRLPAVSGSECIFRTGTSRPGCISVPPQPPGSDRPPTPCDLEDALQNFPEYAGDTLQAKVRLHPTSRGRVNVGLNGGLASDRTALILENQNQLGALSAYRVGLSGGQPHRGKVDTCYAESDARSSPSYVQVLYCDQSDSSLGDF